MCQTKDLFCNWYFILFYSSLDETVSEKYSRSNIYELSFYNWYNNIQSWKVKTKKDVSLMKIWMKWSVFSYWTVTQLRGYDSVQDSCFFVVSHNTLVLFLWCVRVAHSFWCLRFKHRLLLSRLNKGFCFGPTWIFRFMKFQIAFFRQAFWVSVL